MILSSLAKHLTTQQATDLLLKLRQRERLTETDIDSLIMSWAAKNQPKGLKDPIAWVAKAVAKKDVRYYLNYMYADTDKERLIATNGKCIHVMYGQLPDSFYGLIDPKSRLRVDMEAKYPNIDRAFNMDHEGEVVDKSKIETVSTVMNKKVKPVIKIAENHYLLEQVEQATNCKLADFEGRLMFDSRDTGLYIFDIVIKDHDVKCGAKIMPLRYL